MQMLQSLLDQVRFTVFSIDLTLKSRQRFHVHHGPVEHGLIRKALDDPDVYPQTLIPHSVESGQVHYASGDLYRLAFTGLPQMPDPVDLVRRLKDLGVERHGRSSSKLGGNFDVAGPYGLVHGSVGSSYRAGFINQDDIPTSSLKPDKDGCFTLRFFSPLRMPRSDKHRQKGAHFLDGRHFDTTRFLRLLARRIAMLYGLPSFDADDFEEQIRELDIRLRANRLFWLDVPYRSKTLGGAVGDVVLYAEAWPKELLKLLWFGQYLHAGKNSSFGFGEFRLLPGLRPFIPHRARSFLLQMMDEDNLRDAVAHLGRGKIEDVWLPSHAAHQSVQAAKSGCGSDDPIEAESALDLDFLGDEVADLRQGRYRASRLDGVFFRTGKSKFRPLAIPPLRDRLWQRAALQVLSAAVDTVLSESAYAYRAGLSRFNAADAIEKAYRDGYKVVLEADILSFFDTVSLEAIESRVRALWRDDPITDLIVDWIRAPVVFDGQVITRDRGLPQGAVISPLLSNLFLSDFDRHLVRDGLRLVRYGDDFVVIGRTREEVENALEISRSLLEKSGLSLNEEKTDIVDYDKGFRFLGFLFCRSVVLESQEKNKEEPGIIRSIPELEGLLKQSTKPLQGWARLVDPEKSRREKQTFWQRPFQLDSDRERETAPLYLFGWNKRLAIYQDDLVVSDVLTNERQRIPWRNVSDLILAGPPSLSGRFLYRVCNDGTPVILCRNDGEILGVLNPSSMATRYEMLELQLRKSHQVAFCLVTAKAVVSAKINNQIEVLRRQVHPKLDRELKDLRECRWVLKRTTGEIKTMEELRAMEGRAARIFFSGYARCMPPDFEAMGKRGRGATDPTNALLNFLYTLVFRHIRLALESIRLHSGIGFMHNSRGRFAALAADMEEEFRHVAELMILKLVHQGTISRKDFYNHKDDRRVWLTSQARSRIIMAFEAYLDRPRRVDGYPRPMTYRELMVRQARLLRLVLQDKAPHYEAFRLR